EVETEEVEVRTDGARHAAWRQVAGVALQHDRTKGEATDAHRPQLRRPGKALLLPRPPHARLVERVLPAHLPEVAAGRQAGHARLGVGEPHERLAEALGAPAGGGELGQVADVVAVG